ncbi:MAG: hypothetical protein CMH31_02715 [Micavibrio sp.]|nr:hypothetical protein [Micavibrio sp.]
MDFKSFDFKSLKKLANPKAADDLNIFLEKLPQNAGKTVLIAAGVAWGAAAAIGLYTAVQMQGMIELRAQLKETKALKPAVPSIQEKPISKADVESFVKEASDIYRGIDIKANGSSVVITARSTANFTEFREALGHVQNGGQGWRVSLEKLCVGRECDKTYKLGATLKVNKVTVSEPKGGKG